MGHSFGLQPSSVAWSLRACLIKTLWEEAFCFFGGEATFLDFVGGKNLKFFLGGNVLRFCGRQLF